MPTPWYTSLLSWLLSLLLLLSLPAQAQEDTVLPDLLTTPVAAIESAEQDILNVLLIGSATENGANNPGLSDSILLLSINRQVPGASLLSIPRDLYVEIPGFGMGKINQAYFYGATRNADHDGAALLRQTIRHNLGIEIDYYARIDFSGFSRLIDAIGGIRITVDCIIEDWKLIEPELDKQDPANWEMVTLDTGVHLLDGEWALWYVRSRRTSSDLDRGRRQQDVLRAIWRRIQARGLLEDLPALWDLTQRSVETDLNFNDALALLPLALQIDLSEMQYFTLRLRHEVNNGYTQDEGRFILEPNHEAIASLLQTMMQPATRNRIGMDVPRVAIVNASGIRGLDLVAADRLELEGFRTVIVEEAGQHREWNRIIDYTGLSKGNPLAAIQRVLRVTEEGIEIMPDAAREVDYKVYIGARYSYNACTRPVIQPTPTPPESPDNAENEGE